MTTRSLDEILARIEECLGEGEAKLARQMFNIAAMSIERVEGDCPICNRPEKDHSILIQCPEDKGG